MTHYWPPMNADEAGMFFLIGVHRRSSAANNIILIP
jgi:hypothetical protein